MIGQALKRETLPSPLGALLPITFQYPKGTHKSIIENTSFISPNSFDIFSKTTKVCKPDNRVHLYTVHRYDSQRGYSSIVYSRISLSV